MHCKLDCGLKECQFTPHELVVALQLLMDLPSTDFSSLDGSDRILLIRCHADLVALMLLIVSHVE